jgi:putative peptidoglycan lipid II flippase
MDWKNKQLRVIVRMMTARTLSLVINQINLLVETIFASTLAAGSLAVFNLANNLQSFPVGIFGLSFAIAAFPAIAASAFDREKLVYYFSKTIRQVWYFIVPSMALLILLPGQLVRLVLAGGRFDASDTWLTTQTVSLFAISLFAQATIPLLVRFYYARHDSRTPLRLGLIASVINIALNAWLVKSLGVAGLALAFSLSSVVQFALLLIWLRVEIGTIDGVNLLKSLVKMMMSVLVAAAVVQVTKVWWSALGGGGVGAWVWQLMVPAMILMLVYIAMTYLLACPELLGLLGYLKGRWSPTKTEDRGEVSGL